jgi:hypothetical protein
VAALSLISALLAIAELRMPIKAETISIALQYTTGEDEPSRGIFRNQAVEPDTGGQLLIQVHHLDDPDAVLPGNPHQRQVHLVGTAAGLEAFGTYLIALARLETADPEPHGHFDDVKANDGGTISLIPRRLARLP